MTDRHEPQPFDVKAVREDIAADRKTLTWLWVQGASYFNTLYHLAHKLLDNEEQAIAEIERLRAAIEQEGRLSEGWFQLYTKVDQKNDQLHQQLAERDKEIVQLKVEAIDLKQTADDADMLMGNAWQQVVDIARGEQGIEGALRVQCTKLTGDVMERDDELAALRERAEKAEQDAGRYRWLREGHAMEPYFFEHIPDTDAGLLVSGDELDRAIDAARGA